jgi:hypothetical protein
MPVEAATYIDGLNTSNPTGSDPKSQGDDHLRLIKGVLKATFPSLTGPITVNQGTINGMDARVVALETLPSQVLRKDGSVALTGNLNLNSNRIIGIGAPTAPEEAARLAEITAIRTTLTTRGDLMVRSADGLARLGLGSNGRWLKSNGTDPEWADLPAASDTTSGIARLATSGELQDEDGTYPANIAVPLATLITSGLGVSKSASSGWIRLPGGLYMNFGRIGLSISGGETTVTFPKAFPTACICAIAVAEPGDVTGSLRVVQIISKSTTNFKLNILSGSGARQGEPFHYIAIGY